MIKIGSHVSNNGNDMLVGAVKEAISYNANALMLYLGAPQNSFRKPLSQFNVPQYQQLLQEYNIPSENVIVHAPYIINLAQSDEEKRKYAVDFLVKEIILTAQIKAKYIVVHPGAHVGAGIDAALKNISKSFQEVLEKTNLTNVDICIETMAGKGSECCSKFEEIQTILQTVNNPRLNVCFDTCHTWDSGYDLINDYEKVITKFDELIGLDKLKVIHLNDSKNICGSHKDRHENIGFGNIGFPTLLKFIHDERFENIIKILETPYVKENQKEFAPYKEEISMLKNKVFNPNLIDNIKNQ